MAKKLLNFKVEPEYADKLKQLAESKNKTVSDIITESLTAYQTSEQELTIMKNKLAELETKYEKLSGKKVTYEKRISVPVTLDEWNKLDDLAHNRKTTKAKLIRQALTATKSTLPALEG